MNRLRACIVFFAFAVIAARAEQTNMPAPTSATSNAAPSGVTSNVARGTITRAQAEQNFVRLWTDAIARNAHPPFREIGGKVYDFSAAIEWAKCAGAAESWNVWMKSGSWSPSPVTEQDRKERENVTLYQAGVKKWSGYVVRGQVASVIPDGVIITVGQTEVLLKHHPDQSSLAVNASVDVLAMPVGRFSYTTASGSQVIVKEYDFGTRPTGNQGQQIVPLPPLSE
jgi:hypothetical protein